MSGRSVPEDSTTLVSAGHPEPHTIASCRIEARIPTEGSRLYRATDRSLQKPVIVKLMKPPWDDDRKQVERFLAFGGALQGLASPHVVPVLRAGKDGPTPYILFSFVDGEDLHTTLQRERSLVPQAALRVVLDAAAGLDAAQRRGVLHGDVRPRHLIRHQGDTKVTGFGLSPPHRTAQGRVILGHPAYLAPELVAHKPADHRADLYALGCTLFELLVGRPPHGTGSADALLACQLHEVFPSLRAMAPQTSPELEALLGRMVAREPSQRFSTWSEFLHAGSALLPKLRHLPPSSPALVVEEGRQRGQRFEVAEGETLIGRVVGEGIPLDDARVSRRHAMLHRKGEDLEVVDLDSRNGIRVNGLEVKSQPLSHGDRLSVGDTVLRVEIAGAKTQVKTDGRPLHSPVRGAFGELEVAHSSQHQAEALALARGTPSLPRQELLARLAILFAARKERSHDLRRDVIDLLAERLQSDHALHLRIDEGRPVMEASSAHEAQLLSGVLPAVQRALPGQLSLLTTVRVNVDDRWSVMLAPIRERDRAVGLIVLIKRIGRFDDDALAFLEAACSLLTLREESGS
jgi:hypothetical protein